MNGVSKLSSAGNIVLLSFQEVEVEYMTHVLEKLAAAGVVVDMISQTAPAGSTFRFAFTTTQPFFDTAIKTIGSDKPQGGHSPMISSGYAKINLFGEEMVECVGVAARALTALAKEQVEIYMVTTSDLDISLLVRQEDEDVALRALREVYAL